MKNMYRKHMYYMNDLYMKEYNNYPIQNIYNCKYVKILENSTTGFIRLNITDQVTNEPISYETITVYVTDGMQRDIPIMHLITTINPVKIELPMANELGTQIIGPEYDFSTYNLRVDAFGYFANIVYNIRLFPNVTTDFNIEMIPITQIEMMPVIEERTDIPPHLRDELTENCL